jgi:hypothetical protein
MVLGTLLLGVGVNASAATTLTVSAAVGSHEVQVNVFNPCDSDVFDGMVRTIEGPGASTPGVIALATPAGELLQAAAWSGVKGVFDILPTRKGCNSGHYEAGTYRLTVVASQPVTISTILSSAVSTVAVDRPSGASVQSTRLEGAAAATSVREDLAFTSAEPAAVALFAFSEYAAHVASQPVVCIQNQAGTCTSGDRIVLVMPGTTSATAASYAVQTHVGNGFATFEDEAVAARTLKTDVLLVLPRTR